MRMVCKNIAPLRFAIDCRARDIGVEEVNNLLIKSVELTYGAPIGLRSVYLQCTVPLPQMDPKLFDFMRDYAQTITSIKISMIEEDIDEADQVVPSQFDLLDSPRIETLIFQGPIPLLLNILHRIGPQLHRLSITVGQYRGRETVQQLWEYLLRRDLPVVQLWLSLLNYSPPPVGWTDRISKVIIVNNLGRPLENYISNQCIFNIPLSKLYIDNEQNNVVMHLACRILDADGPLHSAPMLEWSNSLTTVDRYLDKAKGIACCIYSDWKSGELTEAKEMDLVETLLDGKYFIQNAQRELSRKEMCVSPHFLLHASFAPL